MSIPNFLLVCIVLYVGHTPYPTFSMPLSFHQDKKSKEDKSYLEDAVSGDKDDDSYGSDGEDNGPTEHVGDDAAMGKCTMSPSSSVHMSISP